MPSYCPHLADGETEAQRGKAACPKGKSEKRQRAGSSPEAGLPHTPEVSPRADGGRRWEAAAESLKHTLGNTKGVPLGDLWSPSL